MTSTSTTTNPPVESHRFQAWAASLVFTCVCLAAHASTTGASRNGAEEWVLAMLCIEFICSFAGIMAYVLLKDIFVGTKFESGLAFFMVIFWCAGLPTLMNPARGIAVTSFGGPAVVSNANLYFFSWIAFISILFILGSTLQDFTGRDVYSELTPKQSKWMGLLASSIVVLASASEIHNNIQCTKDLDVSFCSRNAYAVALGVLGTVFCAGIMFLVQRKQLTLQVEFGVASLMLLLYTFGVAFVTFGTGSGTTIGNLYFAMWIAFGITVLLGFQCFREFMEATEGGGGGRGNAAGAAASSSPGQPKINLAAAPSLEEVEQANSPTEAVEATR